MSETLDAIQERLSPRQVLTEAREMLKDATTQRVRNFAQRASEQTGTLVGNSSHVAGDILRGMTGHPIPLALAGGAAAATRFAVRAARRRKARAHAWTRYNLTFLIAGAAGVACWAVWKSLARNGTPRLN